MQKGKKFSEIVDYFKSLAQKHIEIKHTEQEKHFFRYELDEVLAGKPAGMNYPALILEGYGFKFKDDKSDNLAKQRTGAFILAKNISDPGDHNYIHQVWEELEEIADDILSKMRKDKRNPDSPIRHFNLESAEGTLIANEFGDLYGLRITYEIECHFSTEVDESKWLEQNS